MCPFPSFHWFRIGNPLSKKIFSLVGPAAAAHASRVASSRHAAAGVMASARRTSTSQFTRCLLQSIRLTPLVSSSLLLCSLDHRSSDHQRLVCVHNPSLTLSLFIIDQVIDSILAILLCYLLPYFQHDRTQREEEEIRASVSANQSSGQDYLFIEV